jgi:hypothetical protein
VGSIDRKKQRAKISCYCPFNGCIQPNLSWAENTVNRWTLASDCSTGHYFVNLFGLHNGFTIFLFPVSTAQFISKFWNNR